MVPPAARLTRMEIERAEFCRELAVLSPAQLSFRPAPDCWSAGQVVLHLVLTENAILASMWRELEARAAPLAVGWRTRFRLLALRVVFLLGLRVRVPVRAVEPPWGISFPDIRQRWDEVRLEFGAFLESCPTDRRQTALFRHPAVGWLTLDQTLNFCRDHVRHHRRQVARLRGARAFPSAA